MMFNGKIRNYCISCTSQIELMLTCLAISQLQIMTENNCVEIKVSSEMMNLSELKDKLTVNCYMDFHGWKEKDWPSKITIIPLQKFAALSSGF